jgi:hypothetical protein
MCSSAIEAVMLAVRDLPGDSYSDMDIYSETPAAPPRRHRLLTLLSEFLDDEHSHLRLCCLCPPPTTSAPAPAPVTVTGGGGGEEGSGKGGAGGDGGPGTSSCPPGGGGGQAVEEHVDHLVI